jgi:hypothetical protein
MDMSVIITTAALASILANALKVWEFVSSRLDSYIKKSNAQRVCDLGV